MGQKVNPISFRLPLLKSWVSKWCIKSNYAFFLHEDLKVCNLLKKRLHNADVGRFEFIRYPGRLIVNIFTARPGLVIGKKGNEIELLKKYLQNIVADKLYLNIIELRNVISNANLISSQVARQIEGRVFYKKVIRQVVQNVMKAGVLGVKIILSGRLGGSEMARKEVAREGSVPLHTLRANLDYGVATALTKFGVIGVKVWLCKNA